MSVDRYIRLIKLHQNGIGFHTIQRRYEIGSSNISLIMERFGKLGFTLDELRVMNPRDVESKFYPDENHRNTCKPLPDFYTIHEMMLNMKLPDLAFFLAGLLQVKASRRIPADPLLQTVRRFPQRELWSGMRQKRR